MSLQGHTNLSLFNIPSKEREKLLNMVPLPVIKPRRNDQIYESAQIPV